MKRNTTRSSVIKIDLADHKSSYELEELIREFLRPSECIVTNGCRKNGQAPEEAGAEDIPADISLAGKEMNRDEAKRFLFFELCRLTGYKPEWGTLTGVRPVKMANELMYFKGKSEQETREMFLGHYCVSPEKTNLVMETSRVQSRITRKKAGRTIGLYIGIPFCPTRCLYCAFTSNQQPYSEIQRYLDALLFEIETVGRRFTGLGVSPESIYIGGGTPTTLRASDLDRLMQAVADSFIMDNVVEYCVEAGRPDTITADRLDVISRHGATRISINPQSMNDKTLELIGRTHRSGDIEDAFGLVSEYESLGVNSDLIAGLPGENYEMFRDSLEKVIGLGPQNITVHTLAVKRSSRLHEIDAEYNYDSAEGVGKMVSDAGRILRERGYRPYYMYRQKHMAGNFENVSYALPGSESVYNIRIMDEHQTIAALGAGGISKAYYEDTNRLERVPNVSNYQIYIERIAEMTERKEKKLYLPFER
ncbi:MAG: coproporphyrinogen dehydrogenase HemZ [Anaerovoracaceae bacterium]|jgi:coproporphyrinogen dehydrogenase HemZ